MGLFKKMAEKAAASMPDYGGDIAGQLQAGEHIVGWAHGMPLAFVTDKNVRRQGVIGTAINATSQLRNESQHLGGEPGSMAMSFPRDAGGQLTFAITDQRLTVWFFGVMMRDSPPAALAAYQRDAIRSIAKTGGSDTYGTFLRITFADDSFIDLSVMEHETYAPFFAAAAELGG